jgi:hypothetical protein
MLPFLIVFSLVAAGGGIWAARREPQPVAWGRFLGMSLAAVLLPVGIQIFPTVVVVLIICLAISLGVWPRLRVRIRSFLPLAALAVVVAYGLACLVALWDVSQYQQLREKYRYESMEGRVPMPSPVGRASQELDTVLDAFEYRNSTRERMLRDLHERQVREFTSSPGFGISRLFLPAEWGLRLRERPGVPDQPRPGSPPATGPSPSATDESDLLVMHDAGIIDFANPLGFGYVKDRRHVAGFSPHAFSDVPARAKHWRVERLDLIGLLLHPEPVAYVSEKLPAMDELRGAPTRSLDAFETAGLEAIRTGQTMHVGTDDSRVRMVGAIRSAKQCVDCHGGQRGDLLGAFSYTLGSTGSP